MDHFRMEHYLCLFLVKHQVTYIPWYAICTLQLYEDITWIDFHGFQDIFFTIVIFLLDKGVWIPGLCIKEMHTAFRNYLNIQDYKVTIHGSLKVDTKINHWNKVLLSIYVSRLEPSSWGENSSHHRQHTGTSSLHESTLVHRKQE